MASKTARTVQMKLDEKTVCSLKIYLGFNPPILLAGNKARIKMDKLILYPIYANTE